MMSLLIDKIKITELVDGEKKAFHLLFAFLFGSINSKKIHLIEELFLEESVSTLKIIYLLGIINITYQHRSKIKGFNEFFIYVMDRAKNEMTNRNLVLTFQKFDKQYNIK
jgi:hypothetical protein